MRGVAGSDFPPFLEELCRTVAVGVENEEVEVELDDAPATGPDCHNQKLETAVD